MLRRHGTRLEFGLPEDLIDIAETEVSRKVHGEALRSGSLNIPNVGGYSASISCAGAHSSRPTGTSVRPSGQLQHPAHVTFLSVAPTPSDHPPVPLFPASSIAVEDGHGAATHESPLPMHDGDGVPPSNGVRSVARPENHQNGSRMSPDG